LGRKALKYALFGWLLIGAGLFASTFSVEETVRLIGACGAGLGIGWLIAAVGWHTLT